MMRIFLALLLAFGLWSNAKAYNANLPDDVDGMLEMLDAALDSSEYHSRARECRIDSLTRRLQAAEGSDRYAIYEAIGDEYRFYNIDSALTYFENGRQEAKLARDTVASQRFAISWAEALPVKGVSAEALELFQLLENNGIASENEAIYYEKGSRLYFSLASDYSISALRRKYLALALEFTDSVIRYCDARSPKAKYFKAALAYSRGDQPSAVSLITDIIDTCPMDDHFFALSASMLGSHYQNIPGKEEETLYYKGLAAISDILCGVKEETALNAVALILYERGDIDMSFKCASHSLDNANKSGSGIRAMQTAGSLPLISESYRLRDQGKLDVLTWMVVALVVALIAIVVAIMAIRCDMSKLRQLRQKSREAHVLKDTFISQFLNLCSLYMEKSEEFYRIAVRKIKANQIDDLYSIIKSGTMLVEQKELFCEIFDKSFIRIYPNFVDEVNNLLMEDKRIELADPNHLSAELRILAFMRLGLDDSGQIARFLRLSLNTIYTYRNKLKSRAKNRDTFEADVMKISQIN